MKAKVRLYLNAARTALVLEGDPEGASLYAAPGDDIPDSAVELFGLVDGTIGADGSKEAPASPNKEKVPSPNKEKVPGDDKGAGDGAGGGTKGADAPAAGAPDDLTLVKFVGDKSAAALVAIGITTFAQVAAIDPASPPAAEGMGARTNWAGIVASAKEIVAEAEPVAAAAGAGQEVGDGAGAASGDGGAGTGDTDQGGV